LIQESVLSPLQAVLLGIVQGMCEFFPISSSAHLKLVRHLLGIENQENMISFDLACHLGTWLALVYFLRRDIWQTLQDPRKIGYFALALIPLVPAYFFLKSFRLFFLSPNMTGYFLLLTALLLFLATQASRSTTKKWVSVLSIGCGQALALIPGLSRSGSTIAMARLCGWTWIDGAKFSFLLAVPTILGGEVLEGMKNGIDSVISVSCLLGLSSSFVVGMQTVKVAFWMYEKQIVRPFVWYCLSVGVLMITIFK